MNHRPDDTDASAEDTFFAFTELMVVGDAVARDDLEATALSVQRVLQASPALTSLPLSPTLKRSLWEDIMFASTSASDTSGPRNHRHQGVLFEPRPTRLTRHPGRRLPSVGTFVTVVIVAAVLIAGIWQGGAFRDLLSGGFGEDPVDFAAIPFLNSNQDSDPDFVASPAASGVCPPYEEEVLTTESGSDLTIDPAGMRDLLAVCIPAFTWPDDVQPDVVKIQARFPDGDWGTSIVAPRSVLAGLNLCAWQHVWIVAMQEGDIEAAAKIKPILVDVLIAEATYQSQAGYDVNLEAVYANDVAALSERAIGCYPMDWAVTPIEAPAGEGTSNVLPSTPAAPTPCDLTRDMPVIHDGDLIDTPATYLKLADGVLSVVCDGATTELVTQVEDVMPLDYPGVVQVMLEPENLGTRRQGLLNIATGDLKMFGFVPQNIRYDTVHPADSPWFIAPDAQDPSRATIIDLRTFTSRDVTDVLDAPAATGQTSVLADYSPQAGTLLLGTATGDVTNGDVPATLNMALVTSIEGDIMSVDAEWDGNYLPRTIGIDHSGETVFAYGWGNATSVVSDALISVVDVATGTILHQESNADITNEGPHWTAGRTQLVYTNANRVVAFNTASGEAADLYAAPVGDTFYDVAYGPDDTRIVVPQYTLPADPNRGEDATFVATLLIDVRTGETETIDGAIVAPNLSPWPYFQRFVATLPPSTSQPVVVTILDLETMQPVGEPIAFPDGTDPSRLLGPDATTSTSDGTTMVIAFTPENPIVVRATAGTSVMATLFEIGDYPGFSASALTLSRDGSWLSTIPAEGGWASAAIVDLSGEQPEVIEIDGNLDAKYISLVQGVDD